ncbi:MAG: CRISPR-associated endonuclease Cas1 [Phycisphaerales bacterium]
MPTGYVVTQGASLRVVSRSLLVEKDDQLLDEIELEHLERLVLIGRQNLTLPAIAGLLKAGIPVALLTTRGAFRGWITGPLAPLLPVRIGQHELWSGDARACAARRIVRSKIEAMIKVLQGYRSNYPELDLRAMIDDLASRHCAAERADSVASLLGIEGAAARTYWSAFGTLNRSPFLFKGRNRRPPRDPINAALGFGYSILTAEARSAVEAAGCDPYLGFYHAPWRGRPSLALDVMEPLRHQIIDRLVLRLINTKVLRSVHFRDSGERGVYFNKKGVVEFLKAYEIVMRETGRRELHQRAERLATYFRSLAAAVLPKSDDVAAPAEDPPRGETHGHAA